MGGRIRAVDFVIEHFTKTANERSASEKTPVYVKVLSLAIPAEAKGSKDQLEKLDSSFFSTIVDYPWLIIKLYY